jgi:uncharacterized protein YgbK (DUF1537 family)
MKIGVIADDFTGASDIALTLAEAGLSVAQFIGVPDEAADAALGAGVVALKSRTAPVAQAVVQSLAACDWLLAQGAGQIVFKVCSTFDSTPQGNIGPVLDALADRLGVDRTVVCPAFPENGRSVYQGHLFVADRLLSESGMQDHPLTPMTDPDLRRVLAAQSSRPVGHIPMQVVLRGARAIGAAIKSQHGHLITDAIRDADLRAIGRAAHDQRLLCGGSGIALGLPANVGVSPSAPAWVPMPGPGAILSGSCSRATRAQVDHYRATGPARAFTAQEAVSGRVTAEMLADWALAQKNPPLIYSSADPETVRAEQDALGPEVSAAAVEGLFSRLAAILADNGTTRIVVAGGETSGAVVAGLRARVLLIGPRLTAGVPMLRVGDGRPLCLALKSGNFGGPDFFAQALARMASAHE